MPTTTYAERRGQVQTYFDRTAADAWAKMTSDAPLSRIRATVRAGREIMRQTLLGWLPDDMRDCRLLDAGCGTGTLATEVARRGAHVVAIDLSPTLVDLARTRCETLSAGSIDFRVGDMRDPALGRFDYVVAMDSLIHYEAPDMVNVITALAQRTQGAILYTFAPHTPLLGLMHAAGRLFPRSERAPSITPVREDALLDRLTTTHGLEGWRSERSRRVTSGFYKSQAMELRRQ